MNKFHLLTLFCLLASIAIGTEGFVQGKTSPRRPAESVSQSTQEEDFDGSENIKGIERPADSSGSLAVPSEEEAPAEEGHPAPEPYSFAYSSNTDDGSSSTREETGDKDGKVTGFYMLSTSDGSQRRVNYIADKTGFHATITTNEVGTESKNPADVTIDSSAPEVVYPEGPTNNESSGSRSNAVSSGPVKKTDAVDDSTADNDDFGSESSASGASSKGASAPRPSPVLSRGNAISDSQQEDNEEEAPAPAPAPAPQPRPQPSQPVKGRQPQPAPQPISRPAPRPQPAPRPAPRPQPAPQPTKTAPRPQPVSRPAPRPQPAPRPAPRPQPAPQPRQQPTKTVSRPVPRTQPAPRPAPRPAPVPTKTSPRPQPRPQPRPSPAPTKSGQRSQAVAPRPQPAPQPAPVQRRPAPRPAPIPVKTSQETNVDDEEESFGSENNEQQSADSSNSQYMVFPLNGNNKVANLINDRRPIVAANRDSGLWLNENQLRNLLAVARYRS